MNFDIFDTQRVIQLLLLTKGNLQIENQEIESLIKECLGEEEWSAYQDFLKQPDNSHSKENFVKPLFDQLRTDDQFRTTFSQKLQEKIDKIEPPFKANVNNSGASTSGGNISIIGRIAAGRDVIINKIINLNPLVRGVYIIFFLSMLLFLWKPIFKIVDDYFKSQDKFALEDESYFKIAFLPTKNVDFKSGKKTENTHNEFRGRFLDHLQNLKEENSFLDSIVKVAIFDGMPSPKNKKEAKEQGKQRRADLVLWGTSYLIDKVIKINLEYLLLNDKYKIDSGKIKGESGDQKIEDLSSINHGHLLPDVDYILHYLLVLPLPPPHNKNHSARNASL